MGHVIVQVPFAAEPELRFIVDVLPVPSDFRREDRIFATPTLSVTCTVTVTLPPADGTLSAEVAKLAKAGGVPSRTDSLYALDQWLGPPFESIVWKFQGQA